VVARVRPRRPGQRGSRRALGPDAFARDARVSAVRVAPSVQTRIQQGRLFIWEDGRPASMVGVNGPVAGVVRIGPV
jgi:hypothetical protein